LEVLDDAGHPCGPGQTGRVYVTNLHNFRGPLVRYELGDEATAGPIACPCGRGLPVLACVHGKSYPMFQLANGRRKNAATVAHLIRKIGGHWQHQVIQKAADHVVVRLAVNADWTAQRSEELTAKLQSFFESPIRVDVEVHDRLPTPAQGKFQSMICEFEPHADRES
jgi:phenylacetate-CoA ligase